MIAVKSEAQIAEYIADHHAYLSRMAQEGHAPHKTANQARQIFEQCRKLYPTLKVPCASTTHEGISYVWDMEQYHLSIAIPSDDKELCSWFAANRMTNEYDGEDFAMGSELPEKLVEHLKSVTPL
jgi:hypothetical protein